MLNNIEKSLELRMRSASNQSDFISLTKDIKEFQFFEFSSPLGSESRMKGFMNLKEFCDGVLLSNKSPNNDLEIELQKEKELIFQLKDHKVFIASLYDLLDRVDEKRKTLEFYNTKLQENVDEAKRLSNEYNYENKKNKLEIEFGKHFKTIDEDFELLKTLTEEVIRLLQEEYISKQINDGEAVIEKEKVSKLDKSNIGVSLSDDDLPTFAKGSPEVKIQDCEDEEEEENTGKAQNVNLLGLSTNNFALRKINKMNDDFEDEAEVLDVIEIKEKAKCDKSPHRNVPKTKEKRIIHN